MRGNPCPAGGGLARAALLAAQARLRRAGAWPRLWLFSDPLRLPDPCALLPSLPRGSAVVLRGASPAVARAAARGCARRGLWLLVGGEPRAAAQVGAGGHWPDRVPGPGAAALRLLGRAGRPGLASATVHGRRGVARATGLGAVAVVSPAFATASHPGAPGLGPHRWARLARAAGGRAVALGGVGPASFRRLPRRWLGGAAGVGAWNVAGQPQCLREVALRLARALPAPLRPTHSRTRPR